MTHTSMGPEQSLGRMPRDAALLAEHCVSEGTCSFVAHIWRAANGTLGAAVLEQRDGDPEQRQVVRFDEVDTLVDLDRLLYLQITADRTEPPRPALLQAVAGALDRAGTQPTQASGH